MDARYALYESALDAVNAYVSEPDEERLAAARESCTEIAARLNGLPVAQSDLSDMDREDLAGLGLSLADYRVPFENEAASRAQCAENLNTLLGRMDARPADAGALKQTLKLFRDVNVIFRQADWLYLNDLFCAFDEPALDAFRGGFLTTLPALTADGLPWDADAAVVEAKLDKLMSDAEPELTAYNIIIHNS